MADNDIQTLNSLIATTIDSIDGYSESAEAADSSRFAEMFRQRANERRAALTRLQAEVGRLGGNPEGDGTALAAAHRGFLHLKAAVTGRDDKAIINEVERGEDHIKAKYEAVLEDTDLSPETRQVIQEAYTSVKEGHDQMRDLKHSMEA